MEAHPSQHQQAPDNSVYVRTVCRDWALSRAIRENRAVSGEPGEAGVFRPGGVSYPRLPAIDAKRAAAFYGAVFGWRVDSEREDPSFEDGTGHVIGHIHADMEVAGEAGVRPYVVVEDVEDTLRTAESNGAEGITPPYPEGGLTVAVFRDPEGNALGIWQRG